MMNGGNVMQFCPRCGAKNQDSRAACWKCLGQLQKADSKKVQRILLADDNEQAAGFQPATEPELEPVAAVPIPELAEPEPAPAPILDVPSVEADPEAVAEEPEPQTASLGDVLIPSPSFGTEPQLTDSEQPTQAVPILGLANFPEDEQAAEPTALDEPETAPAFEIGGLSDEPLVLDDSPADADDGTPWWLTQDDTEDDASLADDKPVLDLDDGGLEIIPSDGADKIISLDDDDEDPGSKQ